ncbi:hypothetical protein A2U01_0009949 [Trifolium medium]|uniref:Uncharacterized protein n=1 Tax=Trifolium medium TaxID=97028 RepID=A0A392MNE3_9FABA|nr:hypothetical protein [Trifolium medium]
MTLLFTTTFLFTSALLFKRAILLLRRSHRSAAQHRHTEHETSFPVVFAICSATADNSSSPIAFHSCSDPLVYSSPYVRVLGSDLL